MNLLSVLSKLNEDDVRCIRCWLRALRWERSGNISIEEDSSIDRYKVPVDVALLSKEMLRIGAEAWASGFRLPPQLTYKTNITAETARKIFGEGS